MTMILAVAAGGAIGAVLRYLSEISLSYFIDNMWVTLGVNVVGSFLLGALVAYFSWAWTPPQELRMFLTVGILGAFTTFSSFSLDVFSLWSLGNYTLAMVYLTGSVVFSIVALGTGMMLVKQVIS